MRSGIVRQFAAFVAIAGAAATATAQPPGGKYDALLRRIPQQSNMLMLVDVDGLFNSPLGQREQWREKAMAKPGGALGLPPTMSRIVVAAGVDLHDLNIDWRIGIAEYGNQLPDLPTLALREGGFVEQINLAQAAWTPRDLYFVTFDSNLLGFVAPADRQAMSHWIDTTFARTGAFEPAFATRAIYQAERGAQVVLALKLVDSVSAPLITPWLASLDDVKATNRNPKPLADGLARVESAYLQVDVKESIEGTIHVEFNRDLVNATSVAKAIVVSALEEAGFGIDDLASWSGGVDGKSIVLKGRLTEDSVRRILGMVHPPSLTPERPSITKAAPGADTDEPTRAAIQNDVVAASQAYFHEITDILDALKQQKAETYTGMKNWYDRSAKRIEELPLLGVDKDLLDWGGTVSQALRGMGSGINTNMQNRKYSVASAPTGYYGGFGFYHASASNAPQEQTRQQGEAMLSVSLDGQWQQIQESVAATRRTLVDRYGVDF